MAEPVKNLALITGASAGLGAAFARELAGRRYDLILVARRRDKLEELGRELNDQYAINCKILPADLATDVGIKAVSESIRQTPELTMLINNAGFGTIGSFTEVDINRHLEMITVHVLATVSLSHAALPAMMANRRGDIINVSSVAGFMASPGGGTYGPTKAYLNSFSQTISHEAKEHGVRVQALCPGFIRTEFHEVGDFVGFDRGRIPSGWWMTPEYVVRKSLQGLDKDQVICIPHIRYKALVALLRNRPIAAMLWPIINRRSHRTK